MFAGHHRLSNLVAIVDANGQQALGYTRDVLHPGPATARWEAFGWEVDELEGHDPERLAATIAALDTERGPPHVLLAETTFGKGVSFMESRIEWHYLPLDEQLHRQARDELDAAAGVGA
jgi:transketolase